MSAQKLVRLVFNGHVLQPDSKTITACGLFDNCVVHCLIHNPRPNAVPAPNQPIDNNQPMPPINEGTCEFDARTRHALMDIIRANLLNCFGLHFSVLRFADGNEQIGIENLINANRNRNRNTQRLLNLSLFLICLSVIISWFFRYAMFFYIYIVCGIRSFTVPSFSRHLNFRIQYFQLFTWYSTVGLVLLTTFFVVIIPLIFLIEREIFRNL